MSQGKFSIKLTYIIELFYKLILMLMSSSYCSADCEAYALQFIQFDMTTSSMDGLNDETMSIFRERWAVECFHGINGSVLSDHNPMKRFGTCTFNFVVYVMLMLILVLWC